MQKLIDSFGKGVVKAEQIITFQL